MIIVQKARREFTRGMASRSGSLLTGVAADRTGSVQALYGCETARSRLRATAFRLWPTWLSIDKMKSGRKKSCTGLHRQTQSRSWTAVSGRDTALSPGGSRARNRRNGDVKRTNELELRWCKLGQMREPSRSWRRQRIGARQNSAIREKTPASWLIGRSGHKLRGLNWPRFSVDAKSAQTR